MTYFYSKYGEVKMRSKERIIAPQFDEIEIDTTVEEDEELEENWKARIKDGKLELEEKDYKAKDLKKEIDSAKSVDEIKTILSTILTDKYGT